MSTNRTYCFTLNNYTDGDCTACTEIAGLATTKDFIAAREIGESGTKHIQGAITFTQPKRFDAVIRFFTDKFSQPPHVEVARSVSHAFDYCEKDGDIIINKRSERAPGRRTDLLALREALDKGGLAQAKADAPDALIRYPAGAKLYVQVLSPVDRTADFRVITFIGAPGTGKTRAAMTYDPYVWSNAGCWFDGYNGESTILLDEFAGDHNANTLPYTFFLRLADRYPLQLPVKGGFVHARHTLLIITSNTEPHEWYIRGNVDAINRRTRHDIGTAYYKDFPSNPHKRPLDPDLPEM